MIENKEINRTFEKYPEYKDSGVEWLGEIPSHWEIKKMKFLGSIFPGLSGKKGDDFSKEFREDFKPFIPFTNICNNLKIDTDQYQYVHIAEFEVQNKVQKNDILFLMSSETLEDIGKCSLYDGKNKELYLNSFCKGFRFNSNKLSTYFVNYLLQGQIYRNYFSLVGRGFTRINLKQEYINDAPIVLPPLQEQTAIANFLDNKTSKIDTAIAQKEQMIALLKERKQIVIQNAVTGKWSMVNGKWGETPKEKMKDSGVEWIGEIPEGWEVKKTKHFGTIKSGEGITNSELKEHGRYEVFGGNGLMGYSDRYNIDDECIIIGRVGALCGNVRLSKGKRFISDNALIFKSNKKFDTEYLRVVLAFADLNKLNTSNAQPLITGTKVMNQQFPFPDNDERLQILNLIETQSIKIDQAITLQQSQIEKLKEYKATLIDSAVMGKIRIINNNII